MEELYDYRKVYNAHAAVGWIAAGYYVVKSIRHSDGELCFGGGWFIVSAKLPTGQVTNHYKLEDWDLFNFVPTVVTPPEFDGHTPAIAMNRLVNFITRYHGNTAPAKYHEKIYNGEYDVCDTCMHEIKGEMVNAAWHSVMDQPYHLRY